MAERRGNLFAQLTRLFRSGPIVKRKIKTVDTRVARADPAGSSSVLLLSKTQGVGLNASLNGQYGHQERTGRLQDYNEMDAYALVNAALDIYADESVAQDANGKTIHIHSDNPAIKENLEELLYNTLNAEFNLRPWTRNLCKYGDFTLYIDVSPQYGVINVIPIAVDAIAREEGYDPEDPLAVRFRWTTFGNKVLENWEVAHFRLLGNDAFLPYGSSMIDGARRSWRQIVMVEDAMLVYRITRAVDRRVFYVDVGGVAPDEIGNYMEAAKMNIKSQGVVDRATGKVDQRYAPLPIRRDTPVPLLDGRTLTIEEMAKEHEAGKVNWVYSVQDDTLETVPGKVIWCGKNYTADRLTRVWLDDGNYVDTAGEHPFVMRDGTHKRADELKPGEALMSLYNAVVSRVELEEEQHVGYLNRKVDRVEWIEGDDVYCMTVVGSNGEEDRHNFAVNARKQDQTIATNSMILLRNSIEEDYWVATRGGETGTKIDTLPAGTNAANVEDVEYIKRQLIAALKVPAAYLGYNDAIPGSSGLAQVDIRFSRTVNMVQRTIVSELNKIAMIHLYASGFRGDDLTDFEISLSNPSTIAQQQKLELLRSRFEIAGTMPMVGESPLMSERWLFRNVIGLNDQEILQVRRERLDDVRAKGALEAAGALSGGGEGADAGEAPADEDLGGVDAAAPPAEPGLETAADDNRGQGDVITSVGGNGARLREADGPVKIATHLRVAMTNRRRNLRRRGNGFPKIADRAVTGATAKPASPTDGLHEAFEDLYEDEIERMHDETPDNKNENRTSVSPMFGMVELRMLHGLASHKNIEEPKTDDWKKSRTIRTLSESYKPKQLMVEHVSVEEFELYDDEDDDKEPTT